MSCLSNNGIVQGCNLASSGGIRNVWITGFDNIEDYDIDPATDKITGITFKTGAELKQYDSEQQAASFSQEWEGDITSGNGGFVQNLLMRFSKLEADKRNEMRYFISTKCIAIIEDKNGKYWIAGQYGGLRPSAMMIGTGAAISELNGYEITLSATESVVAREIEDKTIFSSNLE